MFKEAIRGLRLAIVHNNKLILFAAVGAVLMQIAKTINFSPTGMYATYICIMIVFSAEMLNDVVELICNKITKETDEDIKNIKDISAGVVLVISIMAAFLYMMILGIELYGI